MSEPAAPSSDSGTAASAGTHAFARDLYQNSDH